MAKRIKIGDVMQILTSKGVSYAQVTHKHREYGHLLRILPGTYEKEPKDFAEVVDQEPQFSAFFPVQSAVNKGFFAIVANAPVAKRNSEFPIFRGTNNLGNGDKTIWWFWDGKNEWKIERPLVEEEKRYPQRGIVSAPLLIQRVEEGYRVDRDYI